MSYVIRRSSGEKERFNIDKFRNSLHKSGVSEKITNHIIATIQQKKPKTTRKLHQITTQLLEQESPHLAARYNLKKALMELGPAGYPFEKYIAHLFEQMGYSTSVGTIVHGACVDHEVDVIAQKNATHSMIECKYHNRPGMKSDVKVTLYTQARFEDIHNALKKTSKDTHDFHEIWVVTNTEFTTEAIKYAQCKKMNLLAWKYPHKKSLADLIIKYALHPITSLTILSQAQKRFLLKNGFLLCKDAQKYTDTLKQLGMSNQAIQQLIQQMHATCTLSPQNKQK